MKRLLLSLSLLVASCASAITPGDFSVQVYNGSGFTPYYIPLTNGQVIGKTGGVPAGITITAPAWGSIGGDITSQTDLQAALSAKESALTFSTGLSRTSNTITLATSGITAGSYGSSTQVPRLTFDAYGRATGVTEQTITPAESSVTFTDITTGNASTTKHGYLPKLSGNSSEVFNGVGGWSSVSSGLAIGSTSITGGSGSAAVRRVLFDNNGTLGALNNFYFDDYSQMRVDANVYYGTASGTGVGVFFANGSLFWIGQLYGGLGGQVQMQVVDPHVLNFTSGTSVTTLRVFGDAVQYVALTHNGTDGVLSTNSGNIRMGSNLQVGVYGSPIAQIKRYSLTLTAGTVTQSDTDVTANTHVIMSVVAPGGAADTLDYDVSAGSSFTINSSSSTDTRTVTVTLIIYP